MKQKTSQILFAYWNEVRGSRVAPRRFEIEPSRISEILPETFILERLDRETYRFRLAGTRICEEFGQELRGTNFLDGWLAAGLVAFEAKSLDGSTAEFELLLLPLMHSQDAIDRFVGAVSAISRPTWLGSQKLMRKRLLKHDLIWPQGRPQPILPDADQTPFLPHVRNARIVRADRRQFRVYDGGRAGRSGDEI